MNYCTNCGRPLADGEVCNCQSQQSGQPYQQPQYQQPGQNYQQGYQQPGQNYQQPYGNGGGFRAPIQSRNIAMCIILSIVTCGIYGIYWVICMVNDLNTASGHPDDTSGGVVFLLGIVTCGIYYLYWYYKAGQKVDEMQRMNGQPGSDNGILYLLLSVFGLSIVTYCLIQNELNKVASV